MTVAMTDERFRLEPPHVSIVGYSGRDRAAVERHLSELDDQGVPRPESVPSVWTVEASLLSSSPRIDASPHTSSGEAEPVLVRHRRAWFVTIGSDHTDRHAERISIEAAKRACPKVISADCWPLDAVRDRWDELELGAAVRVSSQWESYQQGHVAMLQPLEWYLDRFAADPDVDQAIFCGTVPTLAGLVIGADSFRATLRDPARDVSLVCEYELLTADPVL